MAAAPSLETSLPGVVVDAEVSRSIYAAQSVLETADAAGARPCVVVSLATNGPVDTGELDSILDYLGPSRSLVLVTGYGPARTTWIPEADETIRAFAAAHPDQVAVADWEAAKNIGVWKVSTDRPNIENMSRRIIFLMPEKKATFKSKYK